MNAQDWLNLLYAALGAGAITAVWFALAFGFAWNLVKTAWLVATGEELSFRNLMANLWRSQ